MATSMADRTAGEFLRFVSDIFIVMKVILL